MSIHNKISSNNNFLLSSSQNIKYHGIVSLETQVLDVHEAQGSSLHKI